MAKTTKGKGKKKKSKGQKKEPSETPKEDAPSPPKRSAKFECQFCGKVVNNAHNLRVHEHHCRSKVVDMDRKEVEREIGSAIRKLKDEFEDQRDIFQKEAAERENMLKKELEELKDILRLEIKMGHHAQDPPEKMEEAVEAQDPHIPPAHPISKPMEEPITQIAVEEKVKMQLPQPVIEESPRKIMNAPPSPSASPAIHVEPVLPMESRPTASKPEPIEVPPLANVQDMVRSDPAINRAIQPVPEITPAIKSITEVSQQEPGTPPTIPSISREMVLELLKEEMGKLDDARTGMSGVSLSTEASERLGNIENKLQSLSSDLSNSIRDSRQAMEKLEHSMEEKLAAINPKRIAREIEKVSDRVFDIMDEVGFGESLNVSKIPPNILEIVYMATLDDVVREMTRSLGDQEAEVRINLALEEVRLKTSGSELFRYDGRNMVTENLARSLKTHMISAKQIQTTYSELLRNLMSTVPHYKSKNFQAMIKIKSQEYAVDRATALSSDVETIRNNMNNMGQMIAAFSSQLSAKAMQLEGDIKKNQDLIASKSDKADMEAILSGMMERAEAERSLSEKIANMMNELDAMKDTMDKISKGLDAPSSRKIKEPAPNKISRKEDEPKAQEAGVKPEPDPKSDKVETPSPDTSIHKEKPPTSDKDKKSKKPDKQKPPGTMVLGDDDEDTGKAQEHQVGATRISQAVETPSADNEQKVMDALAAGNSSKTSIQKATGLGKKEVETILASLVKDRRINRKGPKNRPIYSLAIVKAGEKKKDKKVDGVEKEPLEVVKKSEPGMKKKDSSKKTGKKEPEKKEKKVDAKDAAKDEGMTVQEDKPHKKAKKEEKKPAKPKADRSKGKKPKLENEPNVKTKKEKEPVPAKKKEKPRKEAVREGKEEKSEEALPSKTMEELDETEMKVYSAISKDGITLPNLKKKVEKDVKYTAVLRALRVLLDSGLVEAVTRGRNTFYQKINVKKTDKTGKKEIKQEVK